MKCPRCGQEARARTGAERVRAFRERRKRSEEVIAQIVTAIDKDIKELKKRRKKKK